MFDALSPPRRRLLLALLALVLALILTIVAIAVVRHVRRPAAVDQSVPGPVLLVPGYGGDGDSLRPLAAALTRAGRTAVIVSPVGDGTGDLVAQADHLATVAEQVRTQAGAASVDVIGYSAGGVVARLWVRDGGGAATARRVLTLGSPQHGTTVAALGRELGGGCPTACEQLVPGSALLRRLNAGGETPPGPRWITLRTTADRVVVPVDSAALDGALNLVVQDFCPTSTAGHPDLPTDPVTDAAVTSALGPGDPVAPTGVAC